MVQLHQPAQRVIDPYYYISGMLLHNPYHLIIKGKEEKVHLDRRFIRNIKQ